MKTINLTEQIAALPYIDVVSEPTVGTKDNNIQLYEADLNENPYSVEAMDLIPQLKDDVETMLKDAGIEEASEKLLDWRRNKCPSGYNVMFKNEMSPLFNL